MPNTVSDRELALIMDALMTFLDTHPNTTLEQIKPAFSSDSLKTITQALRYLELGGLVKSTWSVKKKGV